MRDVREIVGKLKVHCFFKGDAEGKKLCKSEFLLVQSLLLHDESCYLVNGLSDCRSPLPRCSFFPYSFEFLQLIIAKLPSAVQHFLQFELIVKHWSLHMKKVFSLYLLIYKFVQRVH